MKAFLIATLGTFVAALFIGVGLGLASLAYRLFGTAGLVGLWFAFIFALFFVAACLDLSDQRRRAEREGMK